MSLHRVLCSLIVLCVLAAPACAGPLARIYIAPGSVILNQTATQQFQVFGQDALGNNVPVTEPITWTVRPEVGGITQSGLLSVTGSPQTYSDAVRATIPSGLWATAEVGITTSKANYVGLIFERSWGGRGPSEFQEPTDIQSDSAGSIYVCDRSARRVQKFDSLGRYITQWAPPDAAIQMPNAMAVDASDNVWLSDYAAGSIIRRFSPSGQLLTEWQAASCISLACHSSGCLYALDGSGSIVRKHDFSGQLVVSWGSTGTGEGQFSHPADLAVDSASNVYVTDTYNHRIQKFDPNGVFIRQWGSRGSGDGQFNYPSAIAVDKENNIYVADRYSRLQKFTPDGAFLGRVALPSPAEELSMTHDGNICMLAGRVALIVDAAGNLLARWGAESDGIMGSLKHIALDADGAVYVASPSTFFINKFGSDGRFLTKFGGPGPGEGSISAMGGICIGPDNVLYVSHPAPNNPSILKYSLAGGYLGEVPGIDPFSDLLGEGTICVAGNGDLYTNGGYIHRISPTGSVLAEWPGTGLYSIAADAQGNVYTPCSNYRMRKCDPWGNLLREWGSFGSGSGQFGSLGTLAVDPRGYLQVIDYGYARMQRFDLQGNCGTIWGARGSEPGQFVDPVSIGCNSHGDVVIGDGGNARLQKFIAAGTSPGAAKSRADGSLVAVQQMVVSAGQGDFDDCCYVQATDGSSGIRVLDATLSRSKLVDIVGFLTTIDGERAIRSPSVTTLIPTVATPLAMNNKSIGGADLNFDPVTGAGQRGVEDGEGANNIGLLMKTTGRATIVGDDFFYIDDGTHAHDATIFTGVRVQSRTLAKPIMGQQVTVTGISRIMKLNDRYFRAVWPRDAADIMVN